MKQANHKSGFKDWFLEGMKPEDDQAHHQDRWWRVMCLTGVDYFSTLGYYLRRRFRRRLNLPLLAATIGTLAFVNYLTASLAHTSEHLKVAKEDAYNSVVALLDARANAYGAYAAQCRGLLDNPLIRPHKQIGITDQMFSRRCLITSCIKFLDRALQRFYVSRLRL